ncbi:MAG: MoaD/ThiS family protein [Polyangiaceae bacterium]
MSDKPTLSGRIARALGVRRAPKISVHLLLKGRLARGWVDVDRTVSLPVASTLTDLFDWAEREGVDLRGAIRESPHLADTLMINGERSPVAENLARELADGDEVYLLAPFAGG